MTNLPIDEIKKPLLSHLVDLNEYDLERLRECFVYELKIHPENEKDIKDIIAHIMIAIDKKVANR